MSWSNVISHAIIWGILLGVAGGLIARVSL